MLVLMIAVVLRLGPLNSQQLAHRIMNELPFELISEIFHFGVTKYGIIPETLAAINHHLREIALRAPQLWSNIYWEPVVTDASEKARRQHNRALLHLERSADALVDLELLLTDELLNAPLEREDVSHKLLATLPHIRYLFIRQGVGYRTQGSLISESQEGDSFLSRLTASATQLEELSLDVQVESDHYALPDQLAQSTHKRLRFLRIGASIRSSSNFSEFGALRTVVIAPGGVSSKHIPSGIRIRSCLESISCAPALTSLHIDDTSQVLSTFPASDNRSFTSATVLHFPTLLHLKLSVVDFRVLSWLECPMLEDLGLGPRRPDDHRNMFDDDSMVRAFLVKHRETLRHLSSPTIRYFNGLSQPDVTSLHFPNLITYQGGQANPSRILIQASILRRLTLEIEDADAESVISMLTCASETLESVTIKRRAYGPYTSPARANWVYVPLTFPNLQEFVSTCREGDIVFSDFGEAPLLRDLTLNGEP